MPPRTRQPLDVAAFDMSRFYDADWLSLMFSNNKLQYFPLNMLTDAAVQDETNVRSQTLPCTTSFTQSELLMTIPELRQAYIRFIRIIRSCYTDDPYREGVFGVADLFQDHYWFMEQHEDFEAKPGAFIKYDKMIRGLFFSFFQQPPLRRVDLLNKCLLRASYEFMTGTMDTFGYPIAAQTSALAQPFRDLRGSSDRSLKAKPKESSKEITPKYKCIGCGRLHTNACATQHILLPNGNHGRWFPPAEARNRICFNWNRGGCTTADCQLSSHRCSVCRSRDHTAQTHHRS